MVLVVLVAVTVRAALYRSSLAAFIAERVEVASPLNAWKRGEGRAGPGRVRCPRSFCGLCASFVFQSRVAVTASLREVVSGYRAGKALQAV